MSFIVLASARLETSDAPVGTSLHRNHYPLIRGVSLHHARQPFVAPLSSYPRCFLASCPPAVRRSVSLLSVDCPQPFSAMLDVGTYRQVRPLFGQLQIPNKSTTAEYSRLSSLRVLGHLPIWKPPFIVSVSTRLENIGRTCRYVPTSQSLSSYPRCFLASCPPAIRRSHARQPFVAPYPCFPLTA